MHHHAKRAAIALAMFAAAPGALAQVTPPASSIEAGRVEYMQTCAACHGESGLGQGPLAEYLSVDVPGLTRLSAGNDGVFPMLRIIHIIDGRTGVRGHGEPMPIWGENFGRTLREERGPHAAEIIVRGRILSIATYLESIQED